MASTAMMHAGSSPLARGLRGHIKIISRNIGIIPARAGFTFRWHGPRRHGWDHPRSRGVYVMASEITCTFAGSSPLARGLHPVQPRHPQRCRIIPARAGFTEGGGNGGGGGGDHPRSRGVYPTVDDTPALLPGSSPLARGLLGRRRVQGLDIRIIPARAGFTPVVRTWLATTRDHPRSRGVYPTMTRRARSLDGSSPLARGLRARHAQGVRRGGIIPARAGFTSQTTRTHPRSPDHPRSRGVYPLLSSATVGRFGSSPLARGLPSRSSIV